MKKHPYTFIVIVNICFIGLMITTYILFNQSDEPAGNNAIMHTIVPTILPITPTYSPIITSTPQPTPAFCDTLDPLDIERLKAQWVIDEIDVDELSFKSISIGNWYADAQERGSSVYFVYTLDGDYDEIVLEYQQFLASGEWTLYDDDYYEYYGRVNVANHENAYTRLIMLRREEGVKITVIHTAPDTDLHIELCRKYFNKDAHPLFEVLNMDNAANMDFALDFEINKLYVMAKTKLGSYTDESVFDKFVDKYFDEENTRISVFGVNKRANYENDYQNIGLYYYGHDTSFSYGYSTYTAFEGTAQ